MVLTRVGLPSAARESFDACEAGVGDYVKGAFGFDSLELAQQKDLSSWF